MGTAVKEKPIPKFTGWKGQPRQVQRPFKVMTKEQARERIASILHSRYLGNDDVKDAFIDYMGPALTTPTAGWPADHTNRCMGPTAFGLFGPASTGKTTMVKLVAEVVQLPFLELDGTCRTQEQLADQLFDLHAEFFVETEGFPGGMADLGGGRYCSAPVIVFFDEAHMLEGGGRWLLKCTERKDATLICSQGQIDTRNIFWVLGTTNPERLDDPLYTRLNQQWLKPYNAQQVARILSLDYPQLSEDDRLLLANYGGLIPRVAWDLADQSCKKAVWDEVPITEAVRAVAARKKIDEEGISEMHVWIMKTLAANNKTMARSRLADAVGCPDEQLEKMHMPRLTLATAERPSLVRVSSKGYELTDAGSVAVARRLAA